MADEPIGRRRPIESSPDSTPPDPVCGGLGVLVRMQHYVISIDAVCRLLVAKRTAAPFDRPSSIELCFQEIELALSDVPRGRFSLLVDTRIGPSRNDFTFEALVTEHRGKLLFGFAKNAALAVTAAGRLQIQRYAKADSRVVYVTDSPAAAFAYLRLPMHDL